MLSKGGAGEDSWESLGLQGDQTVNRKGNQSWIFIGRTDAQAETAIIWPLNAKIQLTGKDPDAGKHWRQEKKGMTEDEMIGWHHQVNGHEFEQALGVGDGQGSLECCSPWGCKESDTTDWTEPNVHSNDHEPSIVLSMFCILYLGRDACNAWQKYFIQSNIKIKRFLCFHILENSCLWKQSFVTVTDKWNVVLIIYSILYNTM